MFIPEVSAESKPLWEFRSRCWGLGPREAAGAVAWDPPPPFSEPRVPTWPRSSWGLHSPGPLLSTCKAAGRRLHPGGASLEARAGTRARQARGSSLPLSRRVWETEAPEEAENSYSVPAGLPTAVLGRGRDGLRLSSASEPSAPGRVDAALCCPKEPPWPHLKKQWPSIHVNDPPGPAWGLCPWRAPAAISGAPGALA